MANKKQNMNIQMKKFLPFIILFLSLQISAQVISSSKWTDLFPYNNVLAIREDNGKLIAATENGIFFYIAAVQIESGDDHIRCGER